MIEILLMFISIVIIIYVFYVSKNKNKFEEVLNENILKYESIIKIQVKTRYFIDKIVNEYKDNQDLVDNIQIYNVKNEIDTNERVDSKAINNKSNNNEKLFRLEKLIKDGYTDVDICNELKIGKGELILLKNLYRK